MACNAKEQIEAMMSDFNIGISVIRKYVTENNQSSSDDLEEFAFCTAIRIGNRDYIKAVAPSFKLHVKQRYLQYIDKTDDADMKAFIREYGLWVKDHLDACDFVIQYLDKDGDVVHWDKNFLKEAYKECKNKDLDIYYFAESMNIERHANGRAKFNDWVPPTVGNDAVWGLDYANQKVYWEGHYSRGAFFEWQWEQDIHADANEKRGYLYILKSPNRFGEF